MGACKRVFLSCVSGQFRECRDTLKDALASVGLEVCVQEQFRQAPGGTLLQKIENLVAGCDVVIALVGDAYGAEPQANEAPSALPRRSYTQWEYFFARGDRLDGSHAEPKEIFIYLATDEYLTAHVVPPEANRPPAELEAERSLEAAFRELLIRSGEDRREFGSLHELGFRVLQDSFPVSAAAFGPPPVRRPNNLPYDSLGTLFKGRDALLEKLRTGFHASHRKAAALVSRHALYGLGGVGKTRLAVEYALRHQEEYTALLFVGADAPEAPQRNLAALCGPLVLNLPAQLETEEAARVRAALEWLQEHPGWFLVFDNVDTPAVAAEVEALLPLLQGGHVVITSRLADWTSGVEPLELDVLAEDDAVAFLLEKTSGRRRETETDAADVRELARALDGLALALEQAGAFISTRRVSFGDYLKRWRSREAKVREWHDPQLMKYPRSVAVTWDTSVEQLDAGARALLRMLCWLSPDPVPRALFDGEAAATALAEGAERIRAAGEPMPNTAVAADVEDALTRLASFSLVKWEPGNAAYRLHRLVAEVTRERLSEEDREAWLEGTLAVVDAYLPGDPPPHDVRSWPRWDPVRSHVALVIEAADAAGLSEQASRLMNELGLLLAEKCVWGEAEPLYRRSLAIDEASLGPDHPDVAIRLNNLALLLRDTNRLAEAEPLYRRALAIGEASLGPDHPNVAIRLNNLAGLLRDTNRLAEAEPLYRRALAIDEVNLGPDHPNVAISLNNLALLLRDTNRLAEAEPLYRRSLAIGEASLGPNHPKVANSLNNLAGLLRATNRLAEAEPLFRRTVAILERFTAETGHEHPKLAIVRENYRALLQAMEPKN